LIRAAAVGILQALVEQFRRFANVYFLIIGGIMFVGQYTDLYETAINPWTTLGTATWMEQAQWLSK
jgi:Phospholipid-translocating ATPase N-terminal